MAVTLERQGLLAEGARLHTFKGERVLIGRGYHNDLVLHDPYVCPSHSRLFCQEGQWYIEDLASSNGVYVGKEKQPIDGAKALASGDCFRLGRTSFRFLLPDHPVMETLILTRQNPLLTWCAKPFHIILLTIMLAALQMVAYYFGHQQFNFYAALGDAFKQMSLFFLLLILFLSCSIPLLSHVSKIALNIGVTMLIACAMTLMDGVSTLIVFNSNSVWLSEWLTVSLNFSLWCLLFYINARLIVPQAAWWKILLGISIPLAIVAYNIFNLSDILKEPDPTKWDRVLFKPAFLPPFANIAPAESFNAFIQRSDTLFADSSKNAAEALAEEDTAP
jgi:hypothetical protein